MFKWKKLGRIFDPTKIENKSWMKEYAQAASVLTFDDFIRVYFSCRSSPDTSGKYVSYLAYIDLDKNDLTKVLRVADKPILSLGDLGTFDEFGTNPASVIRVGNEIRIYYCGWTRCESVPFNSAIGVAFSHDNGNTFERIGKGPVLSYTPDEPMLLGSPKIRHFNGEWSLWYAAGRKWLENDGFPEPVYTIKVAYSQDGINWKKAGRNLIEVKLEENECQASPDVFYYKDRYHMIFSYRYSIGYRSKEFSYRLGYASSDDLIHWKREDAKAGITLSEEGWDSEMISYAHVFELNNKLYMIYQGNNFGRYGIGLAVLETYMN